jgi:RNA polymerase sigma factor (sigma-70 family)
MATIAPEVPVLARDEAFEQLYRRYVKDVYHYALALMRDPADAEDVTQTTFLNAYRAFQRGEEIRKPQNWLIKIAHNVARSRYARVSRRVKEVPLEDHVGHLALPEEEKPNIEGVLHALGRLPFNQRAALVMRELEGRSYTEIADTLDVSVPAVETLIFRARRSLRLRTAALRSILAVPLPSSLAHFVEGGGGAAAGGVGAGLLIKAAVALVVGGLATGIGVERSTRATAAPSERAAPPTAGHTTVVAAKHPSRTTSTHRTARVHRTVARHARSLGRGIPAPPSSQPSAGVSLQPGAATSTSSGPAVTPAPSGVVPTTVQTAVQTVQTVVDTVAQTAAAVTQTAAAVTAAFPVNVPQVPPLPVQAPQLPQLP